MMKPRNQNEDDRQFLKSITRLMRATENEIPQDEETAQIAWDYCLRNGDRLAWALLLQRFNEFVRQGKAPPVPILIGLASAFDRFCKGQSMDEAFGLKPLKRGGQMAGLDKREWARTNAMLVDYFLSTNPEKGLGNAYAQAASFRGINTGGTSDSREKIALDHKKYGVNHPD